MARRIDNPRRTGARAAVLKARADLIVQLCSLGMLSVPVERASLAVGLDLAELRAAIDRHRARHLKRARAATPPPTGRMR